MSSADGTAEEIFRELWGRYASAVNASDAGAYGRLFTADAVRIGPGCVIERGAGEIERAERADYAAARWSIEPTPIEATRLADDWIFGMAQVAATGWSNSDGSETALGIVAAWLLQRQGDGSWSIARHSFSVEAREKS